MVAQEESRATWVASLPRVKDFGCGCQVNLSAGIRSRTRRVPAISWSNSGSRDWLRLMKSPLKVVLEVEKDRAARPDLHVPLVRRRAVKAGDRDVVEPQVDGELGAVMNDVVHDEAAQHGDLGHREDRVLAVAQRPGLEELLVA